MCVCVCVFSNTLIKAILDKIAYLKETTSS